MIALNLRHHQAVPYCQPGAPVAKVGTWPLRKGGELLLSC